MRYNLKFGPGVRMRAARARSGSPRPRRRQHGRLPGTHLPRPARRLAGGHALSQRARPPDSAPCLQHSVLPTWNYLAIANAKMSKVGQVLGTRYPGRKLTLHSFVYVVHMFISGDLPVTIEDFGLI